VVHLDLLFSDSLYSRLQCSQLLILSPLIIIPLAQLVNGLLKLPLLLFNIHIVSLQVLILLLSEDTVQLHV